MKCMLLLVIAAIIIFATSITPLLEHHQIAQAYPCIGDTTKKEYCTGYRDGAIRAHRDFKTGQDLDIDQHRCIRKSTEYCNGYNRGYSDEANFLG